MFPVEVVGELVVVAGAVLDCVELCAGKTGNRDWTACEAPDPSDPVPSTKERVLGRPGVGCCGRAPTWSGIPTGTTERLLCPSCEVSIPSPSSLCCCCCAGTRKGLTNRALQCEGSSLLRLSSWDGPPVWVLMGGGRGAAQWEPFPSLPVPLSLCVCGCVSAGVGGHDSLRPCAPAGVPSPPDSCPRKLVV